MNRQPDGGNAPVAPPRFAAFVRNVMVGRNGLTAEVLREIEGVSAKRGDSTQPAVTVGRTATGPATSSSRRSVDGVRACRYWIRGRGDVIIGYDQHGPPS